MSSATLTRPAAATPAANSTSSFGRWFRRRGGRTLAIIAGCLGRKDEPGTWSFRYEPLAVAGDLRFLRGWTHYTDPPQEFSNLWLIRLTADGRCCEFTEWWMQHD